MSTVNGIDGLDNLQEVVPTRSRRTVWRRFTRHRLALFGLIILSIFAFGAVFGPYIWHHDAYSVDLKLIKSPPTWNHPLGNDAAGRDVLGRLLIAARVSLAVGIVATLISVIIGTTVGLISGYMGGWLDNLLMRLVEMVMTFPTFFALLILVALIGPSIYNIMIIIGVLGWTGKARLVRGQTLSLRGADFVMAARAIGAPDHRIVLRHILPGVVPYIIVSSTLSLAGAILTESSLSFLGLGVRIPTATWGNMMSAAQSLFILQNEPWIWAPPGLAIALTVVGVNFLGDGLRDALDPHSHQV